jgi:hypothetical protein
VDYVKLSSFEIKKQFLCHGLIRLAALALVGRSFKGHKFFLPTLSALQFLSKTDRKIVRGKKMEKKKVCYC